MPELSYPPKLPASPLASFKGHHAAVRVPNYEEARNWYVEKLDFRVLREWEWAGLQLAYLVPPNENNFHIEIFGNGDPKPKKVYTDVVESMREVGYHHLCLQVENVDDTLAELRRRGVTILGEPFEIEEINGRLAILSDPWGNMIEITQPLS